MINSRLIRRFVRHLTRVMYSLFFPSLLCTFFSNNSSDLDPLYPPRCPACHGDMCYKCGTHIFLTGKVTRFCSRCQQGYLDHRYVWWIRFYYCLVLPLALPFIIVYMAVAAVAVIATMCCVGAFCCGSNVTTDHSFDPLRGVAYVGWITLLPISGILYDMGIHGFFLEDFVRWFLDEEDGSNRLSGETNHSHILPIREIPTAVSTVDSTASAL